MPVDLLHAQTPETLDIAYRCHHDWYALAGFIEPNASGRYTDDRTGRSEYYLVYHVPDVPRPIGYDDMIGLVRSVQQLPFGTTERYDLYPEFRRSLRVDDDLWLETSALCWRTQYSLVVIPQLYRAILQSGLSRGKRYMIAALDSRMLALMQKQKLPVHICGKTEYVMGSDKTPVYMELEEGMAALTQHQPRLLKIVSQPVVDYPAGVAAHAVTHAAALQSD